MYIKLIVFNGRKYWEKINAIPKGEERLKNGLNGVYDYWIPEFIVLLAFSSILGFIFLVTQWELNFASWIELFILMAFYGIISFDRYSKNERNKFFIRRMRDRIKVRRMYYVYLVSVVLQLILLILK